MPLSTYSDNEAAAFYQAAFQDSPRLPLMHDKTPRRPLDVKMAVQPCRIVVRPLNLKRKGAGYQRLSVKPSILNIDSAHSNSSKGSLLSAGTASSSSVSPAIIQSVVQVESSSSPINCTPLSFSLNAVGQHFLDLTLSSDGHAGPGPSPAPTISTFVSSPHDRLTRPIRPSYQDDALSSAEMIRSRSFDDDGVRPGLSPITPAIGSSTRLHTPRSISSPLLSRRHSELDPPTVDLIIPSKASETLGAFSRHEGWQDDRPMTPLRAGAKALRLLGGIEKVAGGMGGKKGRGEKRRKEGFLPLNGSIPQDLDDMFQSYSLKGKLGRLDNNNNRPETRQLEDRQPSLSSKSPDEKVVGVLPLPRLFHQRSPLSRCPSPDTQSERSFDNSEGRRSRDSMFADDDVMIVGQDVSGRSSGEMERLGVMSKSQARKQISSSGMAFLRMDPYACTRGPVIAQQHKRRPPPLALTISNGKTHSMPDRIPQARLAPNAIRQAEHIERPPPQRISSLPFTPFARPRVAPAPPQLGRSSSESMARPRFGVDLPVDVSLTSEPNEEVVIVEDPHRKGRSFFIEDESPVHGTFGMSLAKKITLKGMGESWKKAVANRI